jgi:hypothetical protein
MNTQYGNTGSFADHGANNDYDVEVVVEPADEAVEVSVADDYEIDLEFAFEVKDPETGEITLKVENGKVLANPGQWEVK